jgi:hypothetical protein
MIAALGDSSCGPQQVEWIDGGGGVMPRAALELARPAARCPRLVWLPLLARPLAL